MKRVPGVPAEIWVWRALPSHAVGGEREILWVAPYDLAVIARVQQGAFGPGRYRLEVRDARRWICRVERVRIAKPKPPPRPTRRVPAAQPLPEHPPRRRWFPRTSERAADGARGHDPTLVPRQALVRPLDRRATPPTAPTPRTTRDAHAPRASRATPPAPIALKRVEPRGVDVGDPSPGAMARDRAIGTDADVAPPLRDVAPCAAETEAAASAQAAIAETVAADTRAALIDQTTSFADARAPAGDRDEARTGRTGSSVVDASRGEAAPIAAEEAADASVVAGAESGDGMNNSASTEPPAPGAHGSDED